MIRIIINGVLYVESIKMANIFGINPVSGGSPAKDINRIEIINCVDGEIIVTFLNCFVVIKFIRFRIINSGIIREQ